MRRSLYISEAMHAAVEARTGPTEGPSRQWSGIVNRAVERYAETVRRSTLDLQVAEWLLVCDALNGHLAEPASAIATVWADVADAIQMDGLADKWHVDGPALVERLQALPYAGLVAVVDVAERFWAHADNSQPNEDLLLRVLGRDPGRELQGA